MRLTCVALVVVLLGSGLHGSMARKVADTAAHESTLAAVEQSKWISLVDGVALEAWRQPTGEWAYVGTALPSPEDPRMLTTTPGRGVLINGLKGKSTDILSRLEHEDIELHVEFMIPQGSNSGIYFQSRYEIQIFDSWGKKTPSSGDCGAIYERWKDGRGFEGHPPRVNASRPPGEWQSFDVMFRAPRFNSKGEKIANARFIKVVHNGQTIHEKVEVTGPTRASTFNDEKPAGPLMLQGDHGPVAYRNLRLRPIQTKD
jgi:3-keto-disaccharide hydrolase